MSSEMYHIPGATNDPAYGVSAKAFSANYLEALYSRQGAWKQLINFSADVANFGESVTVPSFPTLTAADASLTDGTVANNASSVLAKTILINQAKAIRYTIPENVLMASKIDAQAAFAKEAGKAVNVSIDAEVIELIPSFTHTAGTLGSDLDEGKCLAALQSLVEHGVDLGMASSECVWILPYTQFGAVKALKGYTNYQTTGGSTDGGMDLNAVVDTLYGIPVFFKNDSNMTVTGGKIGALIYKDAVGVAVQRMPSMRPPTPVTGSINVEFLTWALFGVAILKDDVAVKILTK